MHLSNPNRRWRWWLPVALVPTLIFAATQSDSFDNGADYTYDSGHIQVTGGSARLVNRLLGTGNDGNLSVASNQTFNLATQTSNGRVVADAIATPLTAEVSSNGTMISVASGSGFTAGDEILIITMVGSSGNTSKVGQWETARLQSVSSTSLTVTTGLANGYGSSGYKSFVQRIPNYADVSVASNAVLTSSAWNGSTGGIVAFRVAGTLTTAANSTISANALGYRGGAGGLSTGGGGTGGETIDGSLGKGGNVQQAGTLGGGSGEGPSQSVGIPAGVAGLGAGGGGADGTDNADDGAGAGGGGGYGSGGAGGGGGVGCGSPAGRGGVAGLTGVFAGGGGASSCPGGTGGNGGQPGQKGSGCYDTSAVAGAAGTSTTGGQGGGTCGSHYGGAGGGGGAIIGRADLSVLLPGGGGAGGGGSSYGNAGGAGGNGGGIILITGGTLNLSGRLSSTGATGTASGLSNRSASGGSGAGGAIWIQGEAISMATGAGLNAIGGSPVNTSNTEAQGGGGGVGRIRVNGTLINGNSGESAAAATSVNAASSPAAGMVGTLAGAYRSGEICRKTPFIPSGVYKWTGFQADTTVINTSAITFRVSIDGGTNFLTYNGSTWVSAPSAADGAPVGTIHTGMSALEETDQGLLWCAYLATGGNDPASLHEVRILFEGDSDGDGITDDDDNCPNVSNSNQADLDGDEVGDLCDADQDGDGYDQDCDDRDDAVNPGAMEICNNIDDDCDTLIDNDAADGAPGWPDTDGDGYGAEGSQPTSFCDSLPQGYASQDGDCVDSDSSVYPTNTETCDGKDNDCDGSVDEGVTTIYYEDADGDGVGNSNSTIEACSAPDGYVPTGGDPNDGDPDVYPGAPELCDGKDNDGDQQVDEGVQIPIYSDSDGDGFGDPDESTPGCAASEGQSTNGDDCNDGAASINPDATEVCNGADDDCDGITDDGVLVTVYADADGDTYGDPSTSEQACAAGTGQTTQAGDCDDSNGSTYPGAIEIPYDTVDNNCDGSDLVDVDEDNFIWEEAGGDDCNDNDATIYPQAEEIPYDNIDQDCSGADLTDVDEDGFDGEAAGGDDCDDNDPNTNPGATEFGDGKDNDCNGLIDDGLDTTDDDQDGFSEAQGDCNDNNNAVYPDAAETCNGTDDNCNGTTDEGFDQDADTHNSDAACTDGAGDDCDDTQSGVYPGAEELEDGLDNNCDGLIDEGTDAYDDDDDGFSEDEGDCNDANEDIFPGATEILDGLDNNCDGTIDEGIDQDNDSDGFSEGQGDCDDANNQIYPGAEEIEDGLDNNCDGIVDEGFDDTPTEAPTGSESPTATETPTEAPTGFETSTETPTVAESPTEPPTDEPNPTDPSPSESPTVVPTATATPGDPSTPVIDAHGGGCGCASDENAPASWLALVGALLLVRRRR